MLAKSHSHTSLLLGVDCYIHSSILGVSWWDVGDGVWCFCAVSGYQVFIIAVPHPVQHPPPPNRRRAAAEVRRSLRVSTPYFGCLNHDSVESLSLLLDNIFASSLYIPRPLGSRHQFYPHTEDLSLGVWFLNASPPVIRDALAKRSFQWLASSRFSMLCAVRKGMCGASAMGHGSLNGSTHWPS